MMKFKISLIGFILFIVNNLVAAPLDFLTKSLVPETGFDTTTTAFVRDFTTTNSLDDSVDRNVPLGFSFPFGGANYTTVNIVSNGYLRFTTLNNTYYNNGTLTNIDATMPHAIFPYWDDLNPSTGGNIRYSTLGSAPNRRFVTTWTNVPHYNVSGSYTFQVVLYENGSIRFRYDASSNANGSSNGGATIGVIENDTKFDQHSFNTAINATQDILYSPQTARVSLSKTSVTLSDPINGGVNPKAIPGAIIEYTLTAKNSGSAPADNSIIRDSLNTLITTQQYAIWAGGFLTIQTPNLYGGAKTTITDNADSDEGQFINSAGNREVIVNCGTLATGQECVVTYRIIVN